MSLTAVIALGQVAWIRSAFFCDRILLKVVTWDDQADAHVFKILSIQVVYLTSGSLMNINIGH